MTNHKPMKRLSYLSLILLTAVVLSCANSDEPAPNEIVGTWESVEAIGNSQFFQSLIYSFLADNTYEALRVTGQQDTGIVDGYMYREKGTYSLEGTTLRLVSDDITVHAASAYSASSINDLIPTGTTRDEIIEFSLNDDKTELVLDYPDCAPTDNCIDKHTFVKGSAFE